MICDDCGETNQAGTQFCMFCGAYLGWQPEETPQDGEGATRTPPPAGGTDPAPLRAPGQAAQETASATSPPSTSPPARQAAPPAAPPAAPSTAGSEPRHQPTPVGPGAQSRSAAQSPAAAAPPAPTGCPGCGRPVEAGRRFCGHCGEQLIHPGTNAPVTRPITKRVSWWGRLWDSKDRAARRAYRRSLPPLYRWRRVIIAVLAVGLVGAGLTLIGRSPTAVVRARYHDIRKTLVNLPRVTASVIPPEASAAETTPDALVDGTAAAWLMNWTSSTQGSPCGVTPTTAVIQLSFDPTRIREVDLRAGLLEQEASRLRQFRPETIWIAYADQCHEVTLEDVERQPVPLDTGVAVDSLRIGVIRAFPPAQPEGAEQVLGFTEISLRARPAVS